MQERIGRMDKVFVAALNGTAMGGGFELALACDIRLLADRADAWVGLPELSVGIIPGAGGTQRLARAIGPARALELILEARPLRPAAAVDAGLVHRTLPPERLLDQAIATAERLARRSPTSVQATKRAIYEGASRPLRAGTRLESAGFVAAASRPAALQAMRAYLEDVDGLGGAPLEPTEDFYGPWREGTRVDLVGAGTG
jgi:enoyl-CoA hydratase